MLAWCRDEEAVPTRSGGGVSVEPDGADDPWWSLLRALAATIEPNRLPALAAWPRNRTHLRVAIAQTVRRLGTGVVVSGHAEALWRPGGERWWAEGEPLLPGAFEAGITWVASDEDLAVALTTPGARDALARHGSPTLVARLDAVTPREPTPRPDPDTPFGRVDLLRRRREGSVDPVEALASVLEEVSLVHRVDRAARGGRVDRCEAWFDGDLPSIALGDEVLLAGFWSRASTLLPPGARAVFLGWTAEQVRALGPDAHDAAMAYLSAGGEIGAVQDVIAASASISDALALSGAWRRHGDRPRSEAALALALSLTEERARHPGAGAAVYPAWDEAGTSPEAIAALRGAVRGWHGPAASLMRVWLAEDEADTSFEDPWDEAAIDRMAGRLSPRTVLAWAERRAAGDPAPRNSSLWRRYAEVADLPAVDGSLLGESLTLPEQAALAHRASEGAFEAWLPDVVTEGSWHVLLAILRDLPVPRARRLGARLRAPAERWGFARTMDLASRLPTTDAVALVDDAFGRVWPYQPDGESSVLGLAERVGHDPAWAALAPVIQRRCLTALAESPTRRELLFDPERGYDLLAVLSLVGRLHGPGVVARCLVALRERTG
ncbi:MAG: hypothetical protein H6738_25465 [Alphaproteobacteria bacterium]|nr:hypothetical protein [Alphaproteobacteria bacterium]